MRSSKNNRCHSTAARTCWKHFADCKPMPRCACRSPVRPADSWRTTYEQVVCWIGACLADALQYAHERGLVHLDLKPSNVLLTADGQPMLLDFHLARGPLLAGSPAPAWLGGTPGYMAPEHREGLAAVAQGRPLTASIDGRADLWSLAWLLSEMLNDQPRSADDPTVQPARRSNARMTSGLSALLRRCLATDPAERYTSATELAADLRRHLANQPLRGVANRSLLERWRKWRLRSPSTLPLTLLVLFTVLSAGLLALHVRHQIDRAESVLREGNERLEQHRYTERARPPVNCIDSARRSVRCMERTPCLLTRRGSPPSNVADCGNSVATSFAA